MDHNNNHINEKIDFAKSVLEHDLSLINLADAKSWYSARHKWCGFGPTFWNRKRNTYGFKYTFFLSHSNPLWSLKHICDLNADT